MIKKPSESDIGFQEMICKNCHVALMDDHPELHRWKKCEGCGYCTFKEDNLIDLSDSSIRPKFISMIKS